MKTSRFSQEQIIGILKQAEAGATVAHLCREHGMSEQTYYRWKSKYGGMEISEAPPNGHPAQSSGRRKRPLEEVTG